MGTILIKVGQVDVEQIDDDRVCQQIKQNGQFEPESLRAWGAACENGKAKWVLDVGSYGGLFGIAAALMKNSVIGFEPNPILFKRTKANQSLNGVDYKVIQIAVSDKNGKAMLGFNPNVRLTSGASLERKGPAMMEVDLMFLDEIKVESTGNIGLVKIDVEGHEAAVIRGAKNLIKVNKPKLLIETMNDEKRKKEIISLLPDYKVVAFMDNRNLWMEPR